MPSTFQSRRGPRRRKRARCEGQNGETRERVAVEILRKRIVVAVEVKLEERRRRPDEDGREDRGVTLGVFASGLRGCGWSRSKAWKSRRLSRVISSVTNELFFRYVSRKRNHEHLEEFKKSAGGCHDNFFTALVRLAGPSKKRKPRKKRKPTKGRRTSRRGCRRQISVNTIRQ